MLKFCGYVALSRSPKQSNRSRPRPVCSFVQASGLFEDAFGSAAAEATSLGLWRELAVYAMDALQSAWDPSNF